MAEIPEVTPGLWVRGLYRHLFEVRVVRIRVIIIRVAHANANLDSNYKPYPDHESGPKPKLSLS